jgi:microcin C transport system ATP-binding protein
MRNGLAVETGPAQRIFDEPRTEYTKALIAAAFQLKVAPENVVKQ